MHRRERIRRGGGLLAALVCLVGVAGMGADAGALEPGDAEVFFRGALPADTPCGNVNRWDPDPKTRSGEATLSGGSQFLMVAARGSTVLVGDNNIVRKLSADGTDSTQLIGGTYEQLQVAGLAIEPQGQRAYVTDVSRGTTLRVLEVTIATGATRVITEAPNRSGLQPLAVDGRGTIYIAQPRIPAFGSEAEVPARVGKVTNGGIETWVTFPNSVTPTSLAVPDEGHMAIVGGSDGSVTPYNAMTGLRLPSLPAGIVGQASVAVDPSGELVFAATRSQSSPRIVQIDLAAPNFGVRELPERKPAFPSTSLSVGGTREDPVVYATDVNHADRKTDPDACSIKRIMPLAPPAPPTTQEQSSTTVSPTTTPTTVPTQNPPSQPVEVPKTVEAPQAIPRLEAPTAPTPASSDGGSTAVSPPSGEQQLLTGGATDGSSTSGFVPGGTVNPAPTASSGAQGGVPPGAGPPGNPVLTPDPSGFAVPEPLPLASASPPPAAAPAPPAAAPAPPPAASQPIAAAGSTGAPPPVPHAQPGLSAGLSAAPGANGLPPQASPRYAMVRNDDGSGAAFAVAGLFVLGGCTLLSALFLARKSGGRPDSAAARAHAKAWGTGL